MNLTWRPSPCQKKHTLSLSPTHIQYIKLCSCAIQLNNGLVPPTTQGSDLSHLICSLLLFLVLGWNRRKHLKRDTWTCQSRLCRQLSALWYAERWWQRHGQRLHACLSLSSKTWLLNFPPLLAANNWFMHKKGEGGMCVESIVLRESRKNYTLSRRTDTKPRSVHNPFTWHWEHFPWWHKATVSRPNTQVNKFYSLYQRAFKSGIT